MERNFETVMIEQCSPVLAGLKAAGLFRYETSDCKDLAERVRGWNARLGEKGLRVRVLKGCVRSHWYLVYVYRESRLREVLADEMSVRFWHRRAIPSRKRATANRCCGRWRGGCAAKRSFPMRSAYFWAIRSPMWWASSKIRAATSPAAAAGRHTATAMPPSACLPN